MPVNSKGSLATNLEINCEINGTVFPHVVGISYSHIVNGGRKVVLDVVGYHSIESTPIGAKVNVNIGRGESIHNLDFEGFIYEVEPKVSGGRITVIDFIGELARSEIVDYKDKDIIGKDLYYLAASAANYKNVNTDNLTEGSGIFATSDMELSGLKTRKEFIDGCFKYMISIVNDDFHKAPSTVLWRYAIRRNNILDIYKEDSDNTSLGFKMEVSEDNVNLLGKGILASLNTSKLVNSATFQSSLDSSLYATVTDEDSVERNGVASKLYQYRTNQYDKLEKLAYETVLRNKEPTLIYRLQLANAEHLTLGDYVKVTAPPLKDVILPVVEVRHIIRESIESYITLGNPELSMSQLIQSIK